MRLHSEAVTLSATSIPFGKAEDGRVSDRVGPVDSREEETADVVAATSLQITAMLFWGDVLISRLLDSS